MTPQYVPTDVALISTEVGGDHPGDRIITVWQP